MYKTLSPLRYPGGKTIFLPIFQKVCLKNNIKTFIEPYCGGGGLSLSLIANKVVDKVIIGDSDPLVASFWNQILKNNIDILTTKILNTNINIETYLEQKEIYDNFKSGKRYSQIDLAYCFLFRNRTNRAGLIKAGPIGGYLQNNPDYDVKVRFNKENIINKIIRINSYYKKKKIKFKRLDSLLTLEKYRKTERALFYLDPPYFKEGKNLYDSFYKEEDHLELNKKIIKLKSKINFILSYDDSEKIKNMYKSFKSVKISKLSHAANAKTQLELLFHSDNIHIPNIISKVPLIIK